MSLVLLATGASGFLASVALMHVGVRAMWLRYPLAVIFAYVVFLLLLRLWLSLQRRARRARDGTPDFDVPHDLTTDGYVGANDVANFALEGGGDFAGGGAGGSWGDAPLRAGYESDLGGSGGGSSVLDGLDFGGDGDEGCLVVLALLLVLAGVVASFYVVFTAPALLAELIVDGLIVSGLYKRMRKVEGGDWLRTVFRRTWIPVLLTLLFFAAAGFLLQLAAPDAHTIGEAWKTVRAD